MLDFVWTPRRIVKLQEQVLFWKQQYGAKVAEITHLLDQRDKQAEMLNSLTQELDTARKELEEVKADRQQQYVSIADEIARLKNELHTYEVVSTPVDTPKPTTRRKTPVRKTNGPTH